MGSGLMVIIQLMESTATRFTSAKLLFFTLNKKLVLLLIVINLLIESVLEWPKVIQLSNIYCSCPPKNTFYHFPFTYAYNKFKFKQN